MKAFRRKRKTGKCFLQKPPTEALKNLLRYVQEITENWLYFAFDYKVQLNQLRGRGKSLFTKKALLKKSIAKRPAHTQCGV